MRLYKKTKIMQFRRKLTSDFIVRLLQKADTIDIFIKEVKKKQDKTYKLINCMEAFSNFKDHNIEEKSNFTIYCSEQGRLNFNSLS